MLRKLLALLAAACLALGLTACKGDSTLSARDPVTLTMWHVYGEHADSPMNRLIAEFNQTEGREKGVIINVTLMSNAGEIGKKLKNALAGTPGVPDMPDIFSCHKTDIYDLGVENLLDWSQVMTQEELDAYVPSFLESGRIDGQLCIFPLSKSTTTLFLAGSTFARFSAETGVGYDDLATWDGFFDAAEKYHVWSNGKPFCAIDFLIRCVALDAQAHGAKDLYTDDGWYDLSDPILKESWLRFARQLIQGHFVVSDQFSSTQMATGEVVSGLSSSASILYASDTITSPDNTTEPMDLQALPMPMTAGADRLITLAGAGLAATSTTPQKAEAAAVFVRWLTQPERNLDFCVETGYMPVAQSAFDNLDQYDFPSESYQSLYTSMKLVRETGTDVEEPQFPNYLSRVTALNGALREVQSTLVQRYQAGEDLDALAQETWALFESIQ